MTGLDAFCAELRATGAGVVPEMERLETALHTLQIKVIEEYDRMAEIARRRWPLRKRVRRMLELMEQRH